MLILTASTLWLEITALLQIICACLVSCYPLNTVLHARNPRHKGVPETFSKSHILFETVFGLDPDHCTLTSLRFALHQANHCYMFSINHNDAEKAPTSFVFSADFLCPDIKSFESYWLSCLRRWSCFIFQSSGSRTSISIKPQE